MSSIMITDPALLAAFRNTTEKMSLTDPQGNVIGAFTQSLEGLGKLPPGVKSPFTEEEMAERRKERTGRPLSDILRDLRATPHAGEREM